jgi:hypothetical protein
VPELADESPFDWRFVIGTNPNYAICRACHARCHIDHNPNHHPCDKYIAAVSTRKENRWP